MGRTAPQPATTTTVTTTVVTRTAPEGTPAPAARPRRSQKGQPASAPPGDDLAAFVLKLATDRKSPLTIDAYQRAAKAMLDWLRMPARAITVTDLERYRIHLSTEKGYAKASLYLHIKAIQAFFRFLGSDVAKDLRPPKRSASLPKYLTEDEVSRLFAAADAHGNLRDRALLAVLAYTGVRVSELCHIDLSDVDLGEKTIRIRAGKGDKDRMVLFEETTVAALRAHLDVRLKESSKEPALFVTQIHTRISPRTVQELVKGYAKRAGIEKEVTPHVLRHTMATTLLRRGADIRIIQQLLGHASIATTQIYTHLDETTLRTAYAKATPHFGPPAGSSGTGK